MSSSKRSVGEVGPISRQLTGSVEPDDDAAKKSPRSLKMQGSSTKRQNETVTQRTAEGQHRVPVEKNRESR